MTKTNIDYSKTIIYKIVCNDLNVKEIYVGHTTDFTKRKYKHRNNCIKEHSENHHLKIYEFIRQNGGWNNWVMLEIEKYPCNDGNEARSRERYWIETLNSSLNSVIPFKTKDELKESKKESDKIYRSQHKEEMKEYHINYRLDNKETLKEKKRDYYLNHTQETKIRGHNYYEKNKEVIAERGKRYREINKDKIKESRRIRGQIEYTCECGNVVRMDGKSHHLKSKKHQSACVQIN